MTSGVVLYGPPAAGKDTVTGELVALDCRYAHFHRLKVGAGRRSGYRLASSAVLADLRDRGELLYTNELYDATYAIDRPGLDDIIRCGRVPIVHLGQVAGAVALVDRYPLDWVVVGLWCPRDEAERRLHDRDDSRSAERLGVWDATCRDLRLADPALFTLVLNTGTVSAEQAARIIHSCCR